MKNSERYITVIGIDPGITGAVAFIPPAGEQGAEVYDFTDASAMDRIRYHWEGEQTAFLERVSAMPGQGISSTAKFMTNFGIWQGRLEALGIPFEFVMPKKWQEFSFGSAPKIFTVVKKKRVVDTKEMSRACAMRLFPHLSDKLKTKNSHNRADALLLAHYGRLNF